MWAVSNSILLSAVTTGLLCHAIYKRREPDIFSFLRQFLLLVAAALGWTAFSQTAFDPLSIIASTLLFATVHLFTLGLSISIYRLLLHPLRKFPGPWAAKLTKLEGVYYALPGKFHDHMQEIHDKYGDVVRIGPNELSFRSASAVKHLVGKVNKGAYFETSVYTEGEGVPINALVDFEEHKQRRRLWDSAFNQKSLKSFSPMFNRLLDRLIGELHKFEGQTVNFVDWCDYYAFDVMGELAFAKDFGLITGEGNRDYSGFIRSGLKIFFVVSNIPWISPLAYYFPISEEVKQQSIKFRELGSKQYDERRLQGTEPHDIFSHLIDSYTKHAKNAEAHLRADSPVLFIAGSDTTSTTMAFLFYFVLRDRKVYKRLRDEIDQAWDGKSPLEAGMLGIETCPYLHGAIQEALRLVPPAPNGMQRRLIRDTEIDGHFIPAGTLVSVNAWAAQRHAKHFTNPLDFVPERWIDSERDKEWNHVPMAYIPFGIGSYLCIGRALAMQELRLIAVKLMREFDLELAPDFDHARFWADIRSWQAIFKPALPVRYKRRDRTEGTM
ncbi:hypothetical protein AYO21_02853 [Fonsecaea monophora]|uniref:Cytochrome P450 n=1 Tax=Fonsecaea monophora TaxID=254056 RepID=A0A177FHM4_9EURO|nr:hypothetical protein AYO21_02853 [Fonsecaea monophora]OAG42902.1 hypothetical protein AYO21_02853 [Fonsecaea monophora]